MPKKTRKKRTMLRIDTPEGYRVEVGVEDVLELIFGKKPEYTKKIADDGVPIIDIRGTPQRRKKKRKDDEEEEEGDSYYDALRRLGKS